MCGTFWPSLLYGNSYTCPTFSCFTVVLDVFWFARHCVDAVLHGYFGLSQQLAEGRQFRSQMQLYEGSWIVMRIVSLCDCQLIPAPSHSKFSLLNVCDYIWRKTISGFKSEQWLIPELFWFAKFSENVFCFRSVWKLKFWIVLHAP